MNWPADGPSNEALDGVRDAIAVTRIVKEHYPDYEAARPLLDEMLEKADRNELCRLIGGLVGMTMLTWSDEDLDEMALNVIGERP